MFQNCYNMEIKLYKCVEFWRGNSLGFNEEPQSALGHLQGLCLGNNVDLTVTKWLITQTSYPNY